MKNLAPFQAEKNQIPVFLLLYRWTTLLFSLVIIILQNQYHNHWNIHGGIFVLLFFHNALLTYLYWKHKDRSRMVKVYGILDIVLAVIAVTVTGDLSSPYFFYSLSTLFTYVFHYRLKGALGGILVYMIGLIVTNHVSADHIHIGTAVGLENALLLMIQALLFAVLCGLPSILLKRLEENAVKVEVSKQNLLRLYQIACIINVSHTIEDVTTRMISIFSNIFPGQDISIWLTYGDTLRCYGGGISETSTEGREAVEQYISRRHLHKRHEPLLQKGRAVCPIVSGSRLEGIILLEARGKSEMAMEDVALVNIITNMFGTHLENTRLVKMMQEGLLISERKRIARDIHDGLAQSLFFFSAEIQSCRRLLRKENPGVEERLFKLQKAMAASFQEVRSYIHRLRNEDVMQESLLEMVGTYLKKIKADFSLDVHYLPKLEREIAPEAGESVFRIIQEGVNNVIKHADASRLNVYLEVGGEIKLTVVDNGRGFDPMAPAMYRADCPKFGLQSIRERVETLGGEFHIRTGQGEGTVLEILLPNVRGGKENEVHQNVDSR